MQPPSTRIVTIASIFMTGTDCVVAAAVGAWVPPGAVGARDGRVVGARVGSVVGFAVGISVVGTCVASAVGRGVVVVVVVDFAVGTGVG